MNRIYICKNCGLEMVEEPTFYKGRCGQCGYKLYPSGYKIALIPDDLYIASIYPAPSWEEDLKG